jgi:hypothetical protein
MRQGTLLTHLSSPTRRSGGGGRRRRKQVYSESSDDGSDSDIAAIPLEPKKPIILSSDSELSESNSPIVSPTRPSPVKKSQRVCSSEDDNETPDRGSRPDLDSESMSEDEGASPSRLKLKTRKTVYDSDDQAPRKRPRLSKGIRPPSPEPDIIEEVDESGELSPLC